VRSIFQLALAGSRFYPITDRTLSGMSHAEQVRILVESGAKVIQLREKTGAPSKFFADAQASVRIAHQHGAKIIINDRLDLALAVNADGVHLGQEDLPVEAARLLLPSGAILGLSTHNLEQARQAAHLAIDYLAIGPVFPSPTKVSQNSVVGCDAVRKVRNATGDLPIVAIGGITTQNAQEVVAAGADAVAIISDIWAPGSLAAAKIRDFLGIS
jgi:thiamine-phosphate pyrophosphorylase